MRGVLLHGPPAVFTQFANAADHDLVALGVVRTVGGGEDRAAMVVDPVRPVKRVVDKGFAVHGLVEAPI